MYHALAILLVGLIADRRPSKSLHLAGACFAAGVIIFSGCLYVLVLTDARWLGRIVPIGGTLLIVGWLLLAFAALRRSPTGSPSPAE
jgi:uncharacterized membrane protein YgdD (TMEM256/DUF423 family)